ncbi:MAG: APC family permease, partial [Candidatus Woesearchaeota archaeon]
MPEKLTKYLELNEVTFLIIGAIIGSGIFMIPGLAAAAAGTMSIAAWIIVGIMAVLMSMLIAELASTYENAGGLHFYVKKALGRGVAFVVGWACLIISWVTIAMTVSAAMEYLSYLIPLNAFLKAILSITIIAIFTFIAFLGIKNSARTQIFFTSITLLVLWTFIGLGVFKVQGVNFSIPAFQSAPFIMAIILVIEPYIGWQEATFLSEETKNAKKTVPKALVIGTIIIASIYAAVAFIAVGVIGAEHLGTASAPLARVAEVLLPGGGVFIALGALLIIIGCANSWITSSARLPYALGRERILPKAFAKLHSKTNTPYMSLILQAFISSMIVVVATFEEILEMLVPMALFVYLLTFISVPIIRRKEREETASFRVPGATVISIICALFAIGAIIYFLTQRPHAVIDGLSLIALGIPLYFLMKFRHSETFPRVFYSFLSKLPGYDTLSRVSYAKEVSKRMIRGIPPKGKILEVDCKTALFLRDTTGIGDTELRVGTDLSFTPLTKAKNRTEN